MGKIDFDACMGGLNEIGRDHDASTWSHVEVSANEVTASHQLTVNHELQFTHQDIWSLNHSFADETSGNNGLCHDLPKPDNSCLACSTRNIGGGRPGHTQAMRQSNSRIVMLQANEVSLATRLAGS